MDFVAPLCPLGLAAGRMGNFINGELWGRVTDLPWGMVFRQARRRAAASVAALPVRARRPDAVRDPVVVFRQAAPDAARSRRCSCIGYGMLRFIAEFAREPDAFLGLLAFGLTMGQWLCLPMIAAGAVLFAWSTRQT